jgi:multidrug transporter EmrE-like cation transporter
MVLDLASMFFAKKFVLTHNYYWLVATIFGFMTMGLLMIAMMKFKDAAIVNILWSGGIAIGSVLLGNYYFHEKLTFMQLVGIGVIIIGIIFIELFKV